MKRILFVGTAFPPAKAGSAVVMRELLKRLDRNSYRVIAMASDGVSEDADFESRTMRIGSRMVWARRFSLLLRMVNIIFLYRRSRKFAEAFSPEVIVAPYPSLDFLLLGGLLARGLKIPFVPYLHDTILEASEKGYNRRLAYAVQQFVFKNAARVLVMSEGMVDLYKRKYGLDAVSIPHIYDELDNSETQSGDNVGNTAFWAGGVYGINDKALKRVYDGIVDAGLQFKVTSRESRSHLASLGISGDNVEICTLPTRNEYLSCLQRQGVLILALNRPDESRIGSDELATIFPTKTPEYLASGRSILVHCPTDYFLARFFKEHKCGLVVSDTSKKALSQSLAVLLSDSKDVVDMRQKAKELSSMFSSKIVVEKFLGVITDVITTC